MTEDWTFAHLKRAETLWGPHGYHRYPAKFIPQLVHRIIEVYSVPGDLVGDPFLGSATTGIEALRMGRRFWGSDISQVALLISRAKCIPICPQDLAEAWKRIDSQLHKVPLTQLWFERYGILSPANSGEVWIGSKGVSHRTVSEAVSPFSTGSILADAALAKLSLLAAGNIARRVRREVRALHYYFQDMHAALQEMARVIAPGKRLVLIIGDSYRRGVTIPTSAALCEMAFGSGFELERRIVRKIPGRVLVSARDKKTGRFSSTMQSDMQVYPEEYVLVFRRLT